jgi:hypothetical protein
VAAAVARHELVRDPSVPNATIVKRLHSCGYKARISANAVSMMRSELIASGAIRRRPSGRKPKPPRRTSKPKPAPKPRRRRTYAERYPAVARELRADPLRPNPEIADAAQLDGPSLGARRGIVRLVRIELEAAGAIARHRVKGGATHHRSRAA